MKQMTAPNRKSSPSIPRALRPATTYDLRVYISNSSGQNREVNLKFFGDGQSAVETGWFNEDDATTSPGGFKDANQVYYINYRYTWDGDTTPGIAISQRYGRTPFCLYGLTNQVVPGEEVGNTAASSEAEAAPPESGGLTAGFVAQSADQVGVTSDTFYSDESLNSNGEWVDVEGQGKCWRPTKVSAGWRPYTNGRWGQSDDCGWTWISDEDFGWCTEHYGRWLHTEDTGWCWTPGTVWSPAWVSWRTGTGSDCDCVGWAPLPPEAGCQIDVGIGNWVDYTCGLGPDAYTFVNVVDFGADNFARCGTCVMNRGSYVNIFEKTTNITNTSYVNVVNQTNQKYVNIYNGGPNPKWVNKELQKAGRKEMPQIHVNRYDDPTKIKGGKGSHLEGNTLSVAAPKITPTKNPQHAPKVATTIPKNKVDKGWAGIKDPKAKANLENKIAQEAKGNTPKNAPARLPSEVASKLAQRPITTGQVKGLPKGAVVQQPGTRGGAVTQPRVRPGESRQRDWLVSQEELHAPAPVGQIPRKVWQLHQRHNVVRLRDQERVSDNKAGQQRRAKPELRRKAALLPRRKEQQVREASGRVSLSRRQVVRQLPLLANRGRNNVPQRKVSKEFRAKGLSRHKRRNLCKDRGPAGQRGASARAWQDHQPASKKLRECNKGKRSGPG